MQVASYLCAFLASLGLSLALTRGVRNYAIGHGHTSELRFARHVHDRPIPRLGGVAIFVSVVVVVGLTIIVLAAWGMPLALPLKCWGGIGGTATAIFLLGLWDDLFGVGPYVKCAVQAAAAIALYLSGLGVSHMLVLGGTLATPAQLLITVGWVLLITNAFNLIDGLDGLAAGCALFSTLVMFICSLVFGSEAGALVTIILAGAILGFLRFNFDPATIFMGDCGSLFIGFLLATLALVQSAKSSTMIAVAIPLMGFGLPVLDVGVTVLRRLVSGKPVFAADGEHIHHKLLKRGVSQRHAVFVLYGVSALFALTSIIMPYPIGKSLAVVFVLLGIGLLIGLQQLRYYELDELQRVARGTLSQKHTMLNNLRIRRAGDELGAVQTLGGLATALMQTLDPIGFCGVSIRPAAELSMMEEIAPMVKTYNGELQFIWDGGNDCSANSGPALRGCWELTLPLVSSSGKVCGSLSVMRRGRTERLLMDLNLLTLVLQASVADVVEQLMPVIAPKKIEPSPSLVGVVASARAASAAHN